MANRRAVLGSSGPTLSVPRQSCAPNSNGPPPLVDDSAQERIMITASQRHPFAVVTSSRAFSLGARYTCERYGDDDETSGDEDSMASTFVRSLPEEDDGWESGEDLNACELEGQRATVQL